MSVYSGLKPPTNDCEKIEQKKVLYFSDGTLEVNDEIDVAGPDSLRSLESCSRPITVDSETLTWVPWIWHQTMTVGTKALEVCDYVGESLASFFGITTPKYQFEINEYLKLKKEEEEESRNEMEMKKCTKNIDFSLNVA